MKKSMKRNISHIFLMIALSYLAGCSSSDFDIWKADRLAAASRDSYAQAARLYERALGALPAGGFAESVRFKLGKLYFYGGDYAAAMEEFKRLDSKQARRLLAISYFKDSDFTNALEIFNRDKSIKDSEYLYYYGRTLEKSNLYNEALQVYASIVERSVFAGMAKKRMLAINLADRGLVFAGVGPDIVDLIRNSPGLKEYPDASGLYLLMDEKTALMPDDRIESSTHACIKILNDRGKEKFSEVVLAYDSTYERIEIEYARTIKPDGTVVTVGDKNVRDVSLYMNYPLYSNARAKIISMPEISDGCVIEYRIKEFCSKPPKTKDFNTIYCLAMDDPILLEKFQLSIPAERVLKYKIVNASYNLLGFDMKPKEEIQGQRKIYSLEFKNVPQIVPEPAMPPWTRVNPYVIFSTFRDWQAVYEWWQSLYQDKIVVDAAIQTKVNELIDGKTTAEARIRSIYNFCVSQIRYVAVEYGDAGYEPHKAGEVFENKYGDCKDKAILLVTMLKAAGIEAYPVLVATFDSLDVQRDIASNLFNHAIAAVYLNGKLIFMDATAGTASFGDLPFADQGRTVLVFFNDKYELRDIPLFDPEHNSLVTRMRIKAADDESVFIWRQVEARGSYEQAQRFWLKYTMPSLIEEDLKQRARSFAHSAEIEKYEIKNVDDLDKPVELKFSFRSKDFFTKAGNVRIIDQLSGVRVDMVVKDARLYPLEFSALEQEENIIDIELPRHFAVKYLPKTAMEDNKWFYCLSKYELMKKNVIHFYWLFRVKTRDVPLVDYPAYKKAVEALALKLDQKVLLEKR